ncbi:MAG: DUF2946 family protein [Pseudomonadota bacterium]
MAGSATPKQLLLTALVALSLLFAQTVAAAHVHDHDHEEEEHEALCLSCAASADGITAPSVAHPALPSTSDLHYATALPVNPNRPRYRSEQPRAPPYLR